MQKLVTPISIQIIKVKVKSGYPVKSATITEINKKTFLSICIFITHPLGPPLLKIEGDNHPAQIPILLVREEVRG